MLVARDLDSARHALRVIRQMDHRSQRVLDLPRNLHQAHGLRVSMNETGKVE
jgi:hypothetical protein